MLCTIINITFGSAIVPDTIVDAAADIADTVIAFCCCCFCFLHAVVASIVFTAAVDVIAITVAASVFPAVSVTAIVAGTVVVATIIDAT